MRTATIGWNKRDQEARIKSGKPMKAPKSCEACHDETDCSMVPICRAVSEVYGERKESPTDD